jgi:hypothetical protein
MRQYIIALIAVEETELRIRAICPSEHLPAVEEVVIARTALLMHRNREAGRPSLEVLQQAMNFVYENLAAGWLPEASPTRKETS